MTPPTFEDMIFRFSLHSGNLTIPLRQFIEQDTAPQKNRRHEMNMKFKELESVLSDGKPSKKMSRKDILRQAEMTLCELQKEKSLFEQENDRILQEIAMTELELINRRKDRDRTPHIPSCPFSKDPLTNVPNSFCFPDSGSLPSELDFSSNEMLDPNILINEELEMVIHAIDTHGIPETGETLYPVFPVPYPPIEDAAEDETAMTQHL
jgi:hypothetical protein